MGYPWPSLEVKTSSACQGRKSILSIPVIQWLACYMPRRGPGFSPRPGWNLYGKFHLISAPSHSAVMSRPGLYLIEGKEAGEWLAIAWHILTGTEPMDASLPFTHLYLIIHTHLCVFMYIVLVWLKMRLFCSITHMQYCYSYKEYIQQTRYCKRLLIFIIFLDIILSVLWLCWLDDKKGIHPVKMSHQQSLKVFLCETDGECSVTCKCKFYIAHNHENF